MPSSTRILRASISISANSYTHCSRLREHLRCTTIRTPWLHHHATDSQPVGHRCIITHAKQHPDTQHHVPHASAAQHLFDSLDDADSLAAPWQPASAQGRWGLPLRNPHDRDILAYAVPAFFATVLEPVQAMIDTGAGVIGGVAGVARAQHIHA